MNDCNVAWAAGLFEGEGTITMCNGRPRLGLRMTDHETVQRFAAIVCGGKIYGPYENRGNDGFERRPFSYWVADMGAGRIVAELLAPWLSEVRLAKIALVYGETNHVKTVAA